jgi:hypothetical protein
LKKHIQTNHGALLAAADAALAGAGVTAGTRLTMGALPAEAADLTALATGTELDAASLGIEAASVEADDATPSAALAASTASAGTTCKGGGGSADTGSSWGCIYAATNKAATNKPAMSHNEVFDFFDVSSAMAG